jgi:HSP20 family protein
MSWKIATEQPLSDLPRQNRSIKDPTQTGYFNFCRGETWTPNVNLYETEASYLVCVDLAGVEKQEIDVVAENQVLRIRGSRAVPAPPDYAKAKQKCLRMHLMEIDHGPFAREVELPDDVDRAGIAASHRNGFLWIELPKKK